MSDIYENPLCTRYSGPEMKKIFSPDTKFRTWRKLWIALAESERELGLGITEEQIAELRAHVDDIDYVSTSMRCVTMLCRTSRRTVTHAPARRE